MTNTLLAQVKVAVENEVVADQTKDNTPKFEREIPVAGLAWMRLASYVELGPQKQKPFKGKEKPDAPEVWLQFELLGKNHAITREIDGEEKTFFHTMTERMAIKTSEKGKYAKLFSKMRAGRPEVSHMAMMLGEGFRGDIVHNTPEPAEGKEPITYANLYSGGLWGVSAPMHTPVDEEGNPGTPVSMESKIRPLTQPLRLLLWDSPTIEQWDSLFIDGSYTRKDEKGNEVEVSKNWIQNTILNGPAFKGSPLEALLMEAKGDLPAAPSTDPDAAPDLPDEAPEDEGGSADDALSSLGDL